MIGRVVLGGCIAVALALPSLAEHAMTGAPVAMRGSPSGKAQIVQRVPANAEVEVGTCARGWRQASWGSRSGFVSCGAVVVDPPHLPLAGPGMPPPAVYPPPAGPPPAFRWTGGYVGAGFGW